MNYKPLTQEELEKYKALQKKDEIYVEIMNPVDESLNEIVSIDSMKNLAGDWFIVESDENSIIPKIIAKNK